jgi:subtilisin
VVRYALFDDVGTLVPDAKPEDDSGGVGTHTAGILVGLDKGQEVGVAPNAELYVAKAIEGGQVADRILASFEWMLDSGVNVVNLSLGLRGYSPIFASAIAALRNAGVICVASAGNEGPNTSRSPGNYRDVISVGAIDEQDKVAAFSASQRFAKPAYSVPSVVAPGVDIISAVGKSGTQSMSGTSVAAPHIAGLAALLRQAAPKASAADICDAIFASCQRPVGQIPVRVGHGVPNGAEAMRNLAAKGLVDARFLARWSP